MDDVHLILLIGNLLGEDARQTGMGDVERGGGCETVTPKGGLVKQKHFKWAVFCGPVCVLYSFICRKKYLLSERRECLFSCMSGTCIERVTWDDGRAPTRSFVRRSCGS